MAPVDRREHRQQRMRGAGAANVDTAFAFNLGALARPAKQVSLPPPISSRRTPVRTTPQASNGSSRRHRSASLQRSSAVKKQSATQQDSITPKLGKRKRGSQSPTSPDVDDGEPDPLSPDINEAQSIDGGRRLTAQISPIFEGPLEMVDELSVDMEIESSPPKASGSTVVRETPTPSILKQSPASKHIPNSSSPEYIPESSTQNLVPLARRSPRNVGSPTPRVSRPENDQQTSVARSLPVASTPAARNDTGPDDHSEYKISPLAAKLRAKSTKVKNLSPDISGPGQSPAPSANKSLEPNGEDNFGPDTEPSDDSIVHPARTTHSPNDPTPASVDASTNKPLAPRRTNKPRKRRDLESDQDIVQTSPPTSTPRQVAKRRIPEPAEETTSDDVDELSPDHKQAKRIRKPGVRRKQGVPFNPSSSRNVGQELVKEPVQGADKAIPNTTSKAKPQSQTKEKRKPQVDDNDSELPLKRQKHGPTQKITVMRLKGFGLNGLTVVDTTRTAVETLLNNQMIKITEKLAITTDPSRQRDMRSQRNIILAYRDKLDDSFLDLQDANNSAVDNVNKLRQHKKEKKQLQTEYLTIQAERDQLALENDELTVEFQREKKHTEDRHRLSSWMYDIQSAIQRGKKKAKREGKEEQGPDIPVKMLLDGVTRETAGTGGLLSFVRRFNGMLERSAGVLEGRV